MGATTYPRESLDDSREVRKESLPPAYIVVIPNSEGPLFEILQKLLSAASGRNPVVSLDSKNTAPEMADSWLEHRAAAEYLGIGRSTLDRYAESEQIESRKFGGRLEYRLSSLDEFKARHVRPARRSQHDSGIITSAPRSGK